MTVELGPRLLERVLATVILVIGLGELAVAAATTFWHPTATIACDRTTCRAELPSLLAGTSEVQLAVAQLHDSRIASGRAGEWKWLVTSNGHDLALGDATSKDELIAIYRKAAPDFEAFLTDPSRPAFAASWSGLAGPTGVLFGILGVVCVAFAGKWIRGWRATLVVDRVAGVLRITQRPLGGHDEILLADIAAIEASDRLLALAYGVMRYAKITIRDRDGRARWSYRTLFDSSNHRDVYDKLQALRRIVLDR